MAFLKTNDVAILGCGWLGLPLAKTLIKKGYRVRGSTTSEEKLATFSSEGIQPYVIKVSSEGISGDIKAFLAEVDVLIIDFPPGLRKDPEKNFSGAIKNLSEVIEESGVKKVIFVSSTSVYADAEDFPVYTEQTLPNAESPGGQELFSTEKILTKNTFFDTTVLRCGGLIGPDRHPVKYLAGRKNLTNPMGPVNLIHQADCIGIIAILLKNGIFGTLYNAVFPEHPSREEYYTSKARELGLELPEFDHSKPSEGKVISSEKMMRELRYEFSTGIN